jgi:hypothetical protein
MGQLGLKAKGTEVRVYNRVEIPDFLPLNKDQGELQHAPITKSGNVSSAE